MRKALKYLLGLTLFAIMMGISQNSLESVFSMLIGGLFFVMMIGLYNPSLLIEKDDLKNKRIIIFIVWIVIEVLLVELKHSIF